MTPRVFRPPSVKCPTSTPSERESLVQSTSWLTLLQAALQDYKGRLEYLTGPSAYGLPSHLLFMQFYNTTVFLGGKGHNFTGHPAYSRCFREVEDDYFTGCPKMIDEIRCTSLISASIGGAFGVLGSSCLGERLLNE